MAVTFALLNPKPCEAFSGNLELQAQLFLTKKKPSSQPGALGNLTLDNQHWRAGETMGYSALPYGPSPSSRFVNLHVDNCGYFRWMRRHVGQHPGRLLVPHSQAGVRENNRGLPSGGPASTHVGPSRLCCQFSYGLRGGKDLGR